MPRGRRQALQAFWRGIFRSVFPHERFQDTSGEERPDGARCLNRNLTSPLQFSPPAFQRMSSRFAADAPSEQTGFELVWGFSCQVVFWFVGGSLFGARKSFFVPSPAIRFAERAEGVKGPKR
jgi:hypothetical protein